MNKKQRKTDRFSVNKLRKCLVTYFFQKINFVEIFLKVMPSYQNYTKLNKYIRNLHIVYKVAVVCRGKVNGFKLEINHCKPELHEHKR